MLRALHMIPIALSRTLHMITIGSTRSLWESPRARESVTDVLYSSLSDWCHPAHDQTANVRDCFSQKTYSPWASGSTVDLGFVFEVVSSRFSV